MKRSPANSKAMSYFNIGKRALTSIDLDSEERAYLECAMGITGHVKRPAATDPFLREQLINGVYAQLAGDVADGPLQGRDIYVISVRDFDAASPLEAPISRNAGMTQKLRNAFRGEGLNGIYLTDLVAIRDPQQPSSCIPAGRGIAWSLGEFDHEACQARLNQAAEWTNRYGLPAVRIEKVDPRKLMAAVRKAFGLRTKAIKVNEPEAGGNLVSRVTMTNFEFLRIFEGMSAYNLADVVGATGDGMKIWQGERTRLKSAHNGRLPTGPIIDDLGRWSVLARIWATQEGETALPFRYDSAAALGDECPIRQSTRKPQVRKLGNAGKAKKYGRSDIKMLAARSKANAKARRHGSKSPMRSQRQVNREASAE